MNKTLIVLFQIATLIAFANAFAATDKSPHDGLLLDSHIKYADASGHEVESKVILNGDNWTLVGRTPQGNLLYGRGEKAADAAGAPAQAPVDGETIHVLYREVTEAGTEVGASSAVASIGAPVTVDLKDAHIETRVSKIRYNLD